MTKLPSTRILITIALLSVFLIFLMAILFVTNLSFSVWEQLQQKPDWLIWSYLFAIFLLSMLFGRIIWRLLVAKKRQSVQKQRDSARVDNMEAVTLRLEKMGLETSRQHPSVQNVPTIKQTATTESEAISSSSEFNTSPEVSALQAELQEYGRRKTQQTLYIALFGDISSGKSALIKSLIANENKSQEQVIKSSVIGGTTREICHYHWHIDKDDTQQQYILTDMPGLNEQFAELDVLAIEEVRRAHVVIYLCEGDLTASQYNELTAILQLKKPCIVAVNKSDRYSEEERQLIIDKIQQRIADITADIPVLAISAGGMREFIRVTPDGQEERLQRPMPADVQALQEQLHSMMQHYGADRLEQLREKSVASMLNNKLDELEASFRRSQSRRVVNSYTKKAVVASLATISPGTDILVQGYLGIQLIKDLCKLYDVSATDIDANKLIELIQSRMDKTLPLLLAIAGNGFKAFPGVGTVTGGLMHAVAYGMIFDTLGHSVARTLEVTGELSPSLISDLYKEQLGENIESRTKDFIKLVLKLRKND